MFRGLSSLLLVLTLVSGSVVADQILYDFESGSQGWGAYGPLTTDSGECPGAVGQGRYHAADFDAEGWGIVSVSPSVNVDGFDLSAFTSMSVQARFDNATGQPPFSGTPSLRLALGLGDAEWYVTYPLTNTFQTINVDFANLIPDGNFATEPITAAQLADPGLFVKLIVYKLENSGTGVLFFDELTAVDGTGPAGDTLLYHFEDGSQGWGAFGPLTTDHGVTAGAIGQGRYHAADFDLEGWGIVDASPMINTNGFDMSAYTGMSVYSRFASAPGETPFVGTAELRFGLAIGEAEWYSTYALTEDFQRFAVHFSNLEPYGTATAPITEAELADPGLQIKLVIWEGDNSGTGILYYDHVTAIEGGGSGGATAFFPGEVIYSFENIDSVCYPDDWTFFGYGQTDFGSDSDAEDGLGAFQSADWILCELDGHPQCDWVGSAVGIGEFTHAHCVPGGVNDANVDLSQGTGISIRLKNNLNVGFGGTAGARVQLQMVDSDGTQAVLSRYVPDHEAVNRTYPVPEDWTTVTFYFAGMDSFWDIDNAIAGIVPGLNTEHITEIKLIWYRDDGDGVNVFEFDQITLVGDAPHAWADQDDDYDVDLADFGAFQACFNGDATIAPCNSFDADRDLDVDLDDLAVFEDCLLGPNVTSDFYPWCY